MKPESMSCQDSCGNHIYNNDIRTGIKVCSLCNPDFCFNDDHEHTVQESCSAHPLYICLQVWVYIPSLTFPPPPALSNIYTMIHLASWSATKEARRDQEITSWLKLSFNKKNLSPQLSRKLLSKAFSLFKEKTKNYQEDNQRFLHRNIYICIRNWHLFY